MSQALKSAEESLLEALGEVEDVIGEAYGRFVDAGQDHVFRFWSTLSRAEQEQLRQQVVAIDPLAYVDILERTRALASEPVGVLQPAPVRRHPQRGGDPDAFTRAREHGEQELRAGRVAALVVAGGQGTRLGHLGPKGTYPIGPVTDRSLFALQAQRIRGLIRRYGCAVPWLVMTSSSTDTPTRHFFAEHDHFGLDPDDVLFFSQQETPCVDFEGRFMLASPGLLATSPDGHGGVVLALHREGVLDRLAERGITTISYYQVDNPLVRIGDPVLVGFHVDAGAQFTAKVVAKREPMERVGTIARRGQRTVVVEYTEIQEPERSQRGEDGELVHWSGAIGVHAIDVEFLRRAAARADEWLPLHASAKKIPTVAPDVTEHEPNGFKLERFVFDTLAHAERVEIVETLREEEYAPVKNAEGGESPATARQALNDCARRWMRAAHVEMPTADYTLELDHEFIDGPDAFAPLGIRGFRDAPQSIFTASGGTA